MASGDGAVIGILSGGEGSHTSPCFFPSPTTRVVRQKHGLWSQVHLSSSQAPASHWQADPGHIA